MPALRSAAAYVTLIAFAGLFIGGCGGAQSRLASHMRQGEAYFDKGDYAKASVEFRNALQISPRDPQALIMAARATERLGKVPQAAALLQAAIDVAPDNTEARANLGRIMVYARQPEAALKILEPGLATHPDNVALLTYKAVAESQLKRDDAALADIEHALRIAPTDEDAIAVRVGMYRDAHEVSRAEALIVGVLQQHPDSTALRELLVDLYSRSGDRAKAEEQMRALVGLKPQEIRYRDQLAVFYADDNRLDDAQRVLEEGVRLQPKSDAAKLAVVAFLVARRSSADGERALQGFIAQDPDNYDLRLALGELQQRAGQGQLAEATYQEIVRRDGTGPRGLIARDRLASMAVAQNRFAEASKLIAEVLKENPHDSDALTLRAGIALAQHHDYASAIADLRAVLRDQPQEPGVRRLLARAFAENGQPLLAEESYRAALAVPPTDPSLTLELAQLLLSTHRAKDAVTLLEGAVHDAPQDVALREQLTRAYLAAGDFAAARVSAEDVKTLQPNSPSGYMLAAAAAQGQNRLDDAQRELQRALVLDPGAIDAVTALARLEVSRGQVDTAIKLVKSFAERSPADPNAQNLLGELYMAQKRSDLAIAALNRAIELAPTWPEGYRNLAVIKYVSGDTAGAISAYQAGIKAAPTSSRLATELALLYERQGRIDEAISLYQTWHRQNPQVVQVAGNLAMLLVTYRKDQPSLDQARDLIRDFGSSEDGRLLDADGWVRFKRAEYSQALPILERAVEREPTLPQVHYHLGMAELQAGHAERARQELEVATASKVAYDGANEARATLASMKPTG
jgi:Flp pilus assembly protein TadD